MACEQVFIDRLRDQGLRVTQQRGLVLLALHEVEGFATAEEIHARVQGRNPTVDISTVYRTLDLLEDLQLVVTLDPREGERRYELVGVHGPHVHLVCRRCGAIAGVQGTALEGMLDLLRSEHGFAADVEGLVITGMCAACNAGGDAQG